MIKNIFYKIPKLPLSALVFYLGILILWKLGIIPSPRGILFFLETLYISYGLPGLFVASFLEGIVYLGLYFPGSFIVALAVILSDGSIASLLMISLVVATALTLTSSINYFFGRRISLSKFESELISKERKILSKGVFASMLHPNSLAFYFFNSGIKQRNFFKILLVPVIMIPYGFVLGLFFYSIKEGLRTTLGNPYLMITFILLWIVFAFLLEYRK